MLKRFIPNLVGGLVTLLMLGGVAQAAGFDDPESTAWKFRYGLSHAGYAAAWQSYKDQGYVPIDIETDTLPGLEYAGVWQKNTDGRGWVSWRNLTNEDFSTRWKEYAAKGYRVVDQDTEVVNGYVRYSLVMVENKEGLKWKSYRNLTSAAFGKNFRANKKTYKPIDIDATEIGGRMRYSIVWLENQERQGWYEYRDMSPASYGQKFQELRAKGFRVADLDCYTRRGQLTYAAIWEKNEPGRGWAAWREMSATGLRNKWKLYNDQGMRVIDIEVCPSINGGARQFAAVWRENSSRYDWYGRRDAQEALENFAELNDAPGVAAAIISQGKVLFRGGAGYADVGKRLQAHSGTIYRTASIAKAITGVLAFDMQDAGLIALNNRTDSIVTTLEDDHDHTVLQLLQNTGCVGDYDDVLGEENDDHTQYASAQDVLSDKQDGILSSNEAIWTSCTPGSDYKYSTHGYTIAAAAMEINGGQTFDMLLRERIADPLGLSTLRAETRTNTESSGERAKLYEKKIGEEFEAVSANDFQNNSWKWAGGGMEVSPLDLAFFGNALLDNTLFPQSVRDQLWSGTGANSSYGAGWNVNALSNPTLVQKRGRQQAALSHIRIDVDDEIVVVAMTNGTYTNAEASIINNLTAMLMGLAQANP